MNFKSRFNQKYRNNPQSFGDGPMPLVEKALKHVSKGSALDLGVGNGRNTLFLLSKAFNVTGVDLSEEGINILKERSGNNPNLKLIVSNVTEFDTSEKYDMVLAIGLLHFLEQKDIEKLITKMQDLTKVGGINVIATRMTQNMRNDLPHIFKHDELKSFYLQDGWAITEYNEQDRGHAKIATIISKKI